MVGKVFEYIWSFKAVNPKSSISFTNELLFFKRRNLFAKLLVLKSNNIFLHIGVEWPCCLNVQLIHSQIEINPHWGGGGGGDVYYKNITPGDLIINKKYIECVIK